jgi:hypothetical protein
MKVTYGAIVQRASGRFGGTVHSNWKGVDVVRRFAKPSNPNSVGQRNTRDAFAMANLYFALLPNYCKSSFDAFAVGKPLIARNKFIGLNVPLIAGQSSPDNLVVAVGDSTTLPPVAFAPVGGNDQITTDITAPTEPTGWTINRAIAAAWDNQADPTDPPWSSPVVTVHEQDDASNPYAPTITGLTAGTWVTGAFLEWTAPDGTIRYSAMLAGGTVVVT